MKFPSICFVPRWFALVWLAWATCSQAAPGLPTDVVDVQLRWHHQFQFAGYYAALEKGFYRDEGLDVRLHAGDPQHQPVSEVLAGRAQYAEGNSEVLYQRLQGKPLVALAAIFQHSPSVLLTRKSSGIDTVHDLIGKKVMLVNMTEDADFLTMFLNEGVSLSQFRAIPSSYNLDDLVSGKVDAFNSYITNEPYFLQQRNVAYNVIEPASYRIDFYSDVLFTTAAELRDHPERVDAMRRATLKGWQYAMDHPQEIIDLLLNKYPVDKTREHLQFEAAEMRKLIFPDLIEIGHMNPARWQHMADTFVRAGLVKPNYSLDGFIYETAPRRLPDWVLPVLFAAALVLSGVAFAAIYLARLNRKLAAVQGTLQDRAYFFKESQRAGSIGSYRLAFATGCWESSEVLDQIFGIDAGYVKTIETWEALIHPDDVQAVDRYLREEVVGNRQSFNKDYRIVRPSDGEIRWVLGMGEVTFDEQGNAVSMQGTVQDITERKKIEATLMESEERYRELVESSPIGIAVHRGGNIAYANPAAVALMGAASPQELVGLPLLDLVHPDYRQLVMERVKGALLEGKSEPQVEEKFLGLNGKIVDVEVQSTPILYEGAQAVRVSVRDITQRKQAEEKLQFAASVFTHAREGIIITDANARIIDANDSFIRTTGYSHEELMGRNPSLLQSGRQSPEYYADMWADLTANGHWHGEIWNRRKGGEVYPELVTISAVRDATGTNQSYVALFTDISAMKEHQRQLEHIAHYDTLTNLPNRALLADRLQQALVQSQRRGKSLAVAYLDLDGFKAVNDHHGHDAGDELLIAVSRGIKAALREGDTLARIGGDEFVAILGDLERPDECEPVLRRILRTASEATIVNDVALQVSVSVGVTVFPQDGADGDLLIRHADQAMYVAKQAGKNRYHFFDVIHDAAVKTQHQSIENVRTAIDRHEFVLYYQPKVNMKTGEVIGAEALIRWNHPQQGMLLPDAFLPSIEGYPISVEVGEWVIDTALGQIAAWKAGGLRMPVSVNIGASQLLGENFVSHLRGLLETHRDVEPRCLELEVLETSALEDMERVSQIMHTCREMGINFSLDDFGTGYSSLTYLKRLPVGILKIDRSFVRDMLEDPEDLAIVAGVIGLATAFHRQIIPEGVETIAHGDLLLSLGCELAQGYGIARPMPADELPGWVSSWAHPPTWAALSRLDLVATAALQSKYRAGTIH